MKSEDCPFCNKEVIETAFAKEGNYVAIYNHAPIVPGHSLIVPVEHINDMMALTESEYTEMFTFGRKVMKFLNYFFKTNEYNMSLQQGYNAGQSVEHLHLHLIPRKPLDLKPGEEWYHKLMEEEFRKLDSDKIIKNEDLHKISDKLRKGWEEYTK